MLVQVLTGKIFIKWSSDLFAEPTKGKGPKLLFFELIFLDIYARGHSSFVRVTYGYDLSSLN